MKNFSFKDIMEGPDAWSVSEQMKILEYIERPKANAVGLLIRMSLDVSDWTYMRRKEIANQLKIKL